MSEISNDELLHKLDISVRGKTDLMSLMGISEKHSLVIVAC